MADKIKELADAEEKDKLASDEPDDSDAADSEQAAEDKLGATESGDDDSEPKTLADTGDKSVTNPISAKSSRKGKDITEEQPTGITQATPADQLLVNQQASKAITTRAAGQPVSQDDIRQSLIQKNTDLQKLQQQGQQAGAQAMQQSAQTQVTPEQLQNQQLADTVTRGLGIADTATREAATTRSRTYESPAAQKIYNDLIAGRQKQLEQQQNVSNSLLSRGLLQQQQPLAQAQALQQAQVEGAKQITEQAKAPGELAQQNQQLSDMQTQEKLTKALAEKAGRANEYEASPISPAMVNAYASSGVKVEPGATKSDLPTYDKLAQQALEKSKTATQMTMFGNKLNTQQNTSDDKAVMQFNKEAAKPISKAASSQRVLSDLQDPNADAMTLRADAIQLAKGYVDGAGKLNMAEISGFNFPPSATGSFEKLQTWLSNAPPEQLKASLSAMAKRSLQNAQTEYENLKQARGQQHMQTYGRNINMQLNSVDAQMYPNGKASSQSNAAAPNQGLTRIQASDGSLHDVQDLEKAKQIDPGLKVIGQ